MKKYLLITAGIFFLAVRFPRELEAQPSRYSLQISWQVSENPNSTVLKETGKLNSDSGNSLLPPQSSLEILSLDTTKYSSQNYSTNSQTQKDSLLPSGNYLSNLQADKDSPLFTVYAAPLARTEYKIDQGYQLLWYNPIKGIGFDSKDAGKLEIAFTIGGKRISSVNEYFKEPIITLSYSDIVGFYFYPVEKLRVEAFYSVYSSSSAFQDYIITNESENDISFNIINKFSSDKKIENGRNRGKYFFFEHVRKRDGWMVSHDIPLVENFKNLFSTSSIPDTIVADAKRIDYIQNITLKPDESFNFRTVRVLNDISISDDSLKVVFNNLINIDKNELIAADEKAYSSIPRIEFDNKEREMLYYSAFSLIRQCMMPPEGESKYNYYVFSREPKWGWGYGGQVFHESLTMLAYAYMDPEGALNSQRVYFERQYPNGYINYRTGPYLNEKIEHNGALTSSAPWFNYENYELFMITKDMQFLKEAYESGKKFYEFYTAERDSNKNGLYSWGGHAELESVRDALVAVWDNVGWASNFEGPDVNSMLVKEAQSLSKMALMLGKFVEAHEWTDKANSLTKLIDKNLWDSKQNFYFNINKNTGKFSYKKNDDLKIKEIIGFLPMWAGVPNAKRAKLLTKSLFNVNEFWRKNGVPTLSAKDKYYNPLGYWNGPIWVPWQYLIFQGLLDYGYKKEAISLSDKVLNAVSNQLKRDHYFWEFYSADDARAGKNKTYIWSGMVARFLIDIDNMKNGE